MDGEPPELPVTAEHPDAGHDVEEPVDAQPATDEAVVHDGPGAIEAAAGPEAAVTTTESAAEVEPRPQLEPGAGIASVAGAGTIGPGEPVADEPRAAEDVAEQPRAEEPRAEQPRAEQPRAEQPGPPATGDAGVDEAVRLVADVVQGSLEDQLLAYETAHRTLQDRLADVES